MTIMLIILFDNMLYQLRYWKKLVLCYADYLFDDLLYKKLMDY